MCTFGVLTLSCASPGGPVCGAAGVSHDSPRRVVRRRAVGLRAVRRRAVRQRVVRQRAVRRRAVRRRAVRRRVVLRRVVRRRVVRRRVVRRRGVHRRGVYRRERRVHRKWGAGFLVSGSVHVFGDENRISTSAIPFRPVGRSRIGRSRASSGVGLGGRRAGWGGPEGWGLRRVGAPKGGGPEGWGPRRGGPEGWGLRRMGPEGWGPRRVGGSKGGGPEGWGPKISRFFLPLSPQFSFILLLLGGRFVEVGWCEGPLNVHVWALWLSLCALRTDTRVPRREVHAQKSRHETHWPGFFGVENGLIKQDV